MDQEVNEIKCFLLSPDPQNWNLTNACNLLPYPGHPLCEEWGLSYSPVENTADTFHNILHWERS